LLSFFSTPGHRCSIHTCCFLKNSSEAVGQFS
jgi:hypothetical protein